MPATVKTVPIWRWSERPWPNCRPISALPSDCFTLEGLRIAEIAVALDTPPGTIKTRLMHARNKLRAKLEGDYTMNKIDDLINQTLTEEDEKLLAGFQ